MSGAAADEGAGSTAADEGAYVRAVEARAVALRGRGYALSATDIDRIVRWREEGIPLALVLETIEAAVRRARGAGSAARRTISLGSVERALQAEVSARAERAGPGAGARGVGAGATPSGAGAVPAAARSEWVTLKAAVKAAGEGQTNAFMRDALREAWRVLGRAEKAREDAWQHAVALDQVLGAACVRALEVGEREALVAEVRAGLGRGPMSAEARRERETFELFRRGRGRFGIPELLEVLLES